jgi:hypothetical protein
MSLRGARLPVLAEWRVCDAAVSNTVKEIASAIKLPRKDMPE